MFFHEDFQSNKELSKDNDDVAADNVGKGLLGSGLFGKSSHGLVEVIGQCDCHQSGKDENDTGELLTKSEIRKDSSEDDGSNLEHVIGRGRGQHQAGVHDEGGNGVKRCEIEHDFRDGGQSLDVVIFVSGLEGFEVFGLDRSILRKQEVGHEAEGLAHVNAPRQEERVAERSLDSIVADRPHHGRPLG